MASEDSVEDQLLWDPSVLAAIIDGVREPHEFHETLLAALSSVIHELDGVGKDLVVLYARRKAHVRAEERHDPVSQDGSVTNPEC